MSKEVFRAYKQISETDLILPKNKITLLGVKINQYLIIFACCKIEVVFITNYFPKHYQTGKLLCITKFYRLTFYNFKESVYYITQNYSIIFKNSAM